MMFLSNSTGPQKTTSPTRGVGGGGRRRGRAEVWGTACHQTLHPSLPVHAGRGSNGLLRHLLYRERNLPVSGLGSKSESYWKRIVFRGRDVTFQEYKSITV